MGFQELSINPSIKESVNARTSFQIEDLSPEITSGIAEKIKEKNIHIGVEKLSEGEYRKLGSEDRFRLFAYFYLMHNKGLRSNSDHFISLSLLRKWLDVLQGPGERYLKGRFLLNLSLEDTLQFHPQRKGTLYDEKTCYPSAFNRTAPYGR